MGKPVFFHKPGARSIKQVLADKSGSGVAESLGGIAIVLILTAAIATGVVTDMKAVQTLAIKAERHALITSLVGDRNAGASWGTKTAPSTETQALPNGATTQVTMWREVSPVGFTLTAVTATSVGPGAATCTAPASVEKAGCIYATRFHANDLDNLEPFSIVRKDPTTAATPIGTVDARVSTETSIEQGGTIASGSDSKAVVWRYLLNARSLEETGEIRISQAGKTLAIVPLDAAANNYFGTFSATKNVPVTVTVAQGNVVVQTVYLYRAGATS
jgi:hypothetical protein